MQEKEPQPFCMVHVTGRDQAPTVKHYTYGEAISEAKRLAGLNKETPVYILTVVTEIVCPFEYRVRHFDKNMTDR